MLRVFCMTLVVSFSISTANADFRQQSRVTCQRPEVVFVCPGWIGTNSPIPGGWPMPRAALCEENETPKVPTGNAVLQKQQPAKETNSKATLVLPKPKPAALTPKALQMPAAKVDEFLVPAENAKSEHATEVKVGFFNHTTRDIELEIQGEAVKVPQSQFITIRLPRKFSWSEKGSKAREITVPHTADGLEIVFRE